MRIKTVQDKHGPLDRLFRCNAFDVADRMLGAAAPEQPRPEDFGPYNIIRLLGVGAGGEVWLAQEEPVGRQVAIKLLHPTSEPDVLLLGEIKRLGALEHPYIAHLYGHGDLDDGTRWMALEYVEGSPLGQDCAGQSCSVHQWLALFHKVCEAVQFAHSRGIIHGDLKPSNIRVTKERIPKLLDFGLAEQFASPDGVLTQSPTARGFSLAYAAPEQLRGEQVGVGIDVFALGVILYERLAGKLPIDTSTRTYAEVQQLKTSGPKPRPPSLNATGSHQGVSKADWRDLDAICLKAMDPEVNKRYTSVEALIGDLDRFANTEPLTARRPYPRAYRFTKFVSKHRKPAIAASLVFIFIAGLIGFFTLRLAVERDKERAEAARTQQVKQFFLDAFNHAAEDASPTEKARFVALFLDRGSQDARSLDKDPAIQADLYQGFGSMYQEWGSLERAELLTREALAIDQRRFPANDGNVVKAKLALGNVLEERGKYDETIQLANELLRIPPSKSEYPETLTLLANAHFHLGHMQLADSLNEKSLEADKQLHGPASPEIADDLMNLGNTQIERGNYKEAEKFFREALVINQSHFGPDSPQAADSASYVAQALYYQGGREREAKTLLKEALASLKKAHGGTDPRVAFTLGMLGAMAIEDGNMDEAQADFREAADIYRAVRGDAHQSVTIELANLAAVQLRKKDYVAAEKLIRDVIQRFSKVLSADDWNIVISRIELGHALVGQKRYREAQAELLQGYQILSKQSKPDVSWLKTARKDLAIVYKALNQPDQAARFQ